MDQLIANLESTHIEAPLRSDLDTNFVQTLDKAFSFKDGNVKVVGTVNDPWFRAKDLLRCMGYSMDRSSIRNICNKIDDEYKKKLTDVCPFERHTQNKHENKRQIDRLNEGKEVYVNEPGLYQLIMSSKLESAKPFKEFVYKELLPGIRKIVQEKYQRELQGKQDCIEQLSMEVRAVREQNDKHLQELVNVREQNTLALHRLEAMGITLNQTNDALVETREELSEIHDKLDVAVEERAPIPEDRSVAERFVLLKLSNNEYYAIRAQNQSCRTAIRKQERLHENVQILLDFETHPNTKTYYSRLRLKMRDRGVRFIRNNISIKEEATITEQELVEALRDVNEEKRIV